MIVGTLTMVDDHHQANLAERLIAIQHEAHSHVLAATHVHLDHDNRLEVVIMKGRGSQLGQMANQILSLRGVKHGKFVVTTTGRDLSDQCHGRASVWRPVRVCREQPIHKTDLKGYKQTKRHADHAGRHAQSTVEIGELLARVSKRRPRFMGSPSFRQWSIPNTSRQRRPSVGRGRVVITSRATAGEPASPCNPHRQRSKDLIESNPRQGPLNAALWLLFQVKMCFWSCP